MLTVLIADGDLTIRLGVQSVIDKWLNHMRLDEVSCSRLLLEHVIKKRYDLLILDPALAGARHLEIIEEVHAAAPETNILIYSDIDVLKLGSRAIHGGAKGILRKKCTIEDMITAVSRVVEGRMYINPDVAEEIATRIYSVEMKLPHEMMTNREWEVFAMQVCGFSIQQCSQSLRLSVKTVSTYKARLMEKLKIHSTSQIIHYAISQGLLEQCQSRCASLSSA